MPVVKAPSEPRLCVVCASETRRRCGGCRVVRLCGPGCQRIHWRAGHHLMCHSARAGSKHCWAPPLGSRPTRAGAGIAGLQRTAGPVRRIGCVVRGLHRAMGARQGSARDGGASQTAGCRVRGRLAAEGSSQRRLCLGGDPNFCSRVIINLKM